MMRLSDFVTAGLVAWACVISASAQAAPTLAPCAGQHVLYADDVSTASKTGTISSDSGKLKMKLPPGKISWLVVGQPVPINVDICLTVQIPHRFLEASQPWAGLVFGASPDRQNFFAFIVSPDGTAAMLGVEGGKFNRAIDWKKAEGLKSDPGSENLLRVILKSDSFVLSVNGSEFATYKPPVPKGSGGVGRISSSEESQRDAWKFGSLKVTDYPQ